MLLGFENARKGGGDGRFDIEGRGLGGRDASSCCEEIDEFEDEELWKGAAKVGYAVDVSIDMTDDDDGSRWRTRRETEGFQLT